MDTTTGPNKAIASAVAGAVTLIATYIIDQFTKTPLPAEIVSAIQLLVTTGLVYFVPHGGASSAQVGEGS